MEESAPPYESSDPRNLLEPNTMSDSFWESHILGPTIVEVRTQPSPAPERVPMPPLSLSTDRKHPHTLR